MKPLFHPEWKKCPPLLASQIAQAKAAGEGFLFSSAHFISKAGSEQLSFQKKHRTFLGVLFLPSVSGLLWGLTLSTPHQQTHHLFGTTGGISSSCVILPCTEVDCLVMQIQQNSRKCHRTVQLFAIPNLCTAIGTSQRTDCHPHSDLKWHFNLSFYGEGVEIHTLIPLIYFFFPSQSSEMHGDFFDLLKTKSSLNSLIREKHTDSIK